MKRIEVSLKNIKEDHPAFPLGVLGVRKGGENLCIFRGREFVSEKTFKREISLQALSLGHFNILNNLPYRVDFVSV